MNEDLQDLLIGEDDLRDEVMIYFEKHDTPQAKQEAVLEVMNSLKEIFRSLDV